MDFSIASLIASFPDEKLVAPKALEKKLECQDDESTRRLQIALDALEKVGILVKERGRYRRVFEDDVVEGKLRCSSKGFCFAIQDDESAEDIYVRESHLNTAWNGDRVLVKVTKDGTRRRSPEGEVQLILERANQSVLGRVKQVNEDFHAVPLDDRLLFELELQENGTNLKESVEQLVHVEIVRYPLGQNFPVGKIAKVLGIDAEAASDIDIVCCKHDLPREFSETVQKAAKSLPTRLRKADLKDRLDLRDLPTLRISGATLVEFPTADDAITLEALDDHQWRLGVHIADIAHYIEKRSDLDREAERRGTSIHLGETVLPMFPELVHRRCALQVESDRLAISVLITLNEAGEVLEFEIQPTIVNVDYELSYQQAQAILERRTVEAQETTAKEKPKSRRTRKKTIDIDPSDASDADDKPAKTTYRLPSLDDVKQYEPIFDTLDHLLVLSQAMREQRRHRGAFELNLPDQFIPDESGRAMGKYLSTKFQYDDEGALGALVVSSLLPARSIVIESMLLANQIVASHLKALQVPAIYRVHRMPDMGDQKKFFTFLYGPR